MVVGTNIRREKATHSPISQNKAAFKEYVVPLKEVLEHPLLPEGWRKTLPKADHQWVSLALFTHVTSMVGYPSTTPYHPHSHLVLIDIRSTPVLWMPGKLWKVTLVLVHHPGCDNQRLTRVCSFAVCAQCIFQWSNDRL
ncbi:hypothetical protein QZH41_017510 [Actinostola sp. cb2023]|nr:hypothetical protein QZH41_017510 [Actinostola sp. cb2023]